MLFSINMRKKIFQTIEIPGGVDISVKKNVVEVSGAEGKVSKKMNLGNVSVEKKDGKLVIGSETATKNDKRAINTARAHIKNMIHGIQKKFEYHLKVVHSHFPMTVEINGREGIIKNFLGEKVPRKLHIPEGADVKISGNLITITSANKEIAGQASANFERATQISLRDRRVFQDGIFIINKAGKEI